MSLIRKAFKRLHYPADVIAQCVRWYLVYSLSLRDLEEMMTERGIPVDHSTLHRWVIRLVPLLDKAFRRHKRSVGRQWRMDETYIKVKGQWKYLGTVAKLAMRQPFVLFKGLTFQKLCLPGAFRPGDHHNKMLRPGLCVVHASPQYL